jgi:hypothetical protein
MGDASGLRVDASRWQRLQRRRIEPFGGERLSNLHVPATRSITRSAVKKLPRDQ